MTLDELASKAIGGARFGVRRALNEAHREGYLLALVEVERAVYKGEDALFRFLASSPELHETRKRG